MKQYNNILNAQLIVGHFLFGDETLIRYEQKLREIIDEN